MKRLLMLLLIPAILFAAPPPEPRLDLIRHVFGLPAQGQNFPGGGGGAFPLTITGGVSGGIPCFTSTTTETASSLLTLNVLTKGGGAGACPTNSSITDNGTTVAATEPISTTGSLTTGTGCTPAGSTATGGVCMTEGAVTGWTSTAGFDYIRADATHTWLCGMNGSAESVGCAFGTVTVSGSITGTGGSTFTAGSISASVSYLNGNTGRKLFSATAPTVAAAGCGGSAASITTNAGTAAFKVNVGTSNTGTCTITMPAASQDWICSATDITTTSTTVSQTKAKPGGTPTTQVTLQNYTDVSATGAWTDSDVIAVSCWGE